MKRRVWTSPWKRVEVLGLSSSLGLVGFYLRYLAVDYLIHLDTGVVGLTTAVKIQEQGGYAVTVVADTFPSDPKTIKYTSIWAVRGHAFVFQALF